MKEKYFKKIVGKKAEPVGSELEFIYERILSKLSDSEILDEMQGEPFLLRSSGFIKRRRKEFNAAKKVLYEQAQKEVDPILIDRRKKHWNDLAKIAKLFDSMWKRYLLRGKYFEEEDLIEINDYEYISFCLANNYLAVRLLHHLKSEFPQEFKFINEWQQLLVIPLSKECFDKLLLVVSRRTFGGTCDICQGW